MDDDIEMTGFRKTLHFIAEEELGPPAAQKELREDASVAESSEELFSGEKGMLVREICVLDREVRPKQKKTHTHLATNSAWTCKNTTRSPIMGQCP
jgi:hypothetical protein